jgi:LPS-assembly protein
LSQTLPAPPSPAPSPAAAAAPAPADDATVERPDFSVRIPRPDAPPVGEKFLNSDTQDSDNGVYRLHGNVTVELFNATFKADEAEYDENTKIFTARGHVSYRNYDRNELIYCDRAEYNTDTQRGTFYHVRGYNKTKVVARPGILTTQEPFYFEGAYAEKFEDKYILHDGFITDCSVPNPWWTLHGKVFDIVTNDRAISHSSVFRVRGVPVFYFPYFYKGLKKEPRKSGFTTPELGHSSQFGYFFGAGYYWAINRSYDMTYLFQDYTSRGYAHHVDLRGKPTQKSDFNLIVFGVQDRGTDVNGFISKAPGVSITGTGKIEFGDGWSARGNIDYLSSFLFRQTFSYSFNEAVYSSTNSAAYVTKKFDYYTFNTSISRNENFESATPGDSIVIRKLPEFELEGRDRQLTSGALPTWFSFDSTFGLYHRVQPDPHNGPPDGPFYENSQFDPRANLEPTILTSFHWGQLNILPSFTMHETYYGQQLDTATTSVISHTLNRSAPELKIDFSLPPIERIFNKKTFLGDKLKHVIEPRLVYDYVTGVNSFLNTIRFDQTDLLSNTNELEIGITNRLYAKRGNTVTEVFTWELYQKRYFDPTFGGAVVAGQRNVLFSAIDLTGYTFLNGPRNYSPVVSVLRSSPRPGIAFQWEADYDPVYHRMTNSLVAVDVHYKKYFASTGHAFVNTNPLVTPYSNQVRASIGYGDPNRKGWNSAFSTVYDFKLDKLQFAIIQVTYNTNCCGLSAELRRVNIGARDDTQYKVAFSVANIGTFGNLKKQERLF